MKETNWLPTNDQVQEFKLLRDMLRSQKTEFDLLSKKKADGQLNTTKIKMVNRVLEPLKVLLKHNPSHKFLDTLIEDDIPTNSDVVLIISQYETATDMFADKYYGYDKHKHGTQRWITVEFPSDFYAEV